MLWSLPLLLYCAIDVTCGAGRRKLLCRSGSSVLLCFYGYVDGFTLKLLILYIKTIYTSFEHLTLSLSESLDQGVLIDCITGAESEYGILPNVYFVKKIVFGKKISTPVLAQKKKKKI